jgi:hypothetical protein
MSKAKMTKTRCGGVLCVPQPDGSYSDTTIHEAILAGVDDSGFRAQTRRKLLEKGLKRGQIDGLFPDLSPSQLSLGDKPE